MELPVYSDKEQQRLTEIINGRNPVCIHALGQGLANFLSDIIRKQHQENQVLKAELEQHKETIKPYLPG